MRATTTERSIAEIMVIENCLYMIPVEPPKKAMGPKTAESTRPMPTNAPVIWVMDMRAASFGERPSSCISLSTFSTTTMASSTRSPMANTIANIVNMFIEYPNAPRMAKVPKRTTGTAMVGMRVALKLPRKRNITMKTRIIASMRVFITSFIATLTKGVVS